MREARGEGLHGVNRQETYHFACFLIVTSSFLDEQLPKLVRLRYLWNRESDEWRWPLPWAG